MTLREHDILTIAWLKGHASEATPLLLSESALAQVQASADRLGVPLPPHVLLAPEMPSKPATSSAR
jgi:hypothetical protein